MNKNIVRILLVIFLIRLVFALLPSFQVDMSAWLAWAGRLGDGGFANFYSETVWTQYTPGYLYWLWLVGKLGLVDPLAIKIPTILADMLTAGLMWKIIAKNNRKVANWSYVLYVLNPVMIVDGSIWGQIDGILTLFMMLVAYYLIERKSVNIAWLMMGVALLIKPQALAILPILSILTLRKMGMRKLIKGSIMLGGVLLLGYWPFYPNNPITGLLELMQNMKESYPYTSLFAFNIWSFVGMWIVDSTKWLGVSYFQWGTLLMGSAYLIVIARFWRRLNERSICYLILALGCLIFFAFPTRVHERYLFPMFAFLITYTGLVNRRDWWIAVLLTMVSYTLNLYLPYSYYEPMTNGLKNVRLENLITSYHKLLALIPLGLFFWLLSPGWEILEEYVPVRGGKRETVEHGGN